MNPRDGHEQPVGPRQPPRFGPIHWVVARNHIQPLGTLERQVRIMVWICAGLLMLLVTRMIVLETIGGSGKETGLPILIFLPIILLATQQRQIVKHIRKLSEESRSTPGAAPKESPEMLATLADDRPRSEAH